MALPPTATQWAALLPLQRFALVKLARSRHENENFVPAMREFGLLHDKGAFSNPTAVSRAHTRLPN